MIALILALILAVALASSGPQPAPKALVGAWVLSQDGEGAPACTITLKPGETIGGFEMAVPKPCSRVIRHADDMAAWYVAPNGVLTFADATRRGMLRLKPGTGGGWISAADGEHYLMSRPSKAPTLAQRMSGHWRLVALGGVPLCDFDLTSNPAGSAGTLKPRGACKAPWTGKAFSGWSLKGRRITLADPAGKPIIAIADCGLGGCTGETPAGDFIGFTPEFE